MASPISFDTFLDKVGNADKKLLKTLRRKLKTIVLRAEREAKKNATTYPRVRTGMLRASITSVVDGSGGRFRARLVAGGDGGVDPVQYARYVEFGTSRMAPRFFMKRGFQTSLKKAPKALKEILSLSLQVK